MACFINAKQNWGAQMDSPAWPLASLCCHGWQDLLQNPLGSSAPFAICPESPGEAAADSYPSCCRNFLKALLEYPKPHPGK